MKNKLLKILFSFCLIFASTVGVSGCFGGPPDGYPGGMPPMPPDIIYTVNFMIDGEVVETKQGHWTTELEAPTAPIKEGYTHVGWKNILNPNNESRGFADKLTPGDVTFDANFTIDVEPFYVPSDVVLTLKESSNIQASAWAENQMNLTVYADVFEHNLSDLFNYDESVTIKMYNSSWEDENTLVENKKFDYTSDSSQYCIVLTNASGASRTYSFHLYREGKMLVSFEGSDLKYFVNFGEKISRPDIEIPSVDGYIAYDWDFDFENTPIYTNTKILIRKEQTFKRAKIHAWVNGGYEVVWESGYDLVYGERYWFDGLNLYGYTKDYYQQDGLYSNAEFTGERQGFSESVSLNFSKDSHDFYIKYTPIRYKMYISYIHAENSYWLPYELDYTVEDEIDLAPYSDLVDDCYDFVGWRLGDQTELITKIPKGTHGDQSVNSVWNPKTFTITYIHGDGTMLTPDVELPTTYVYGEGAVLQTPKKMNYDFVKWTDEDGYQATGIDIYGHGDRVYTSHWTPTVFNILYKWDKTEGSDLYERTFTIDNLEAISDYTRLGYNIDGWRNLEDDSVITTKDGDKYSLNLDTTKQLKDLVVYANKSVINYKITYTGGFDTNPNPTTFNVETGSFRLQNPSLLGYNFAGWEVEGKSLTSYYLSPYSYYKDITVNINWNAIQYKISYVYNDGSDYVEEATYTIEDEVELIDPNVPGYKVDKYLYNDVNGAEVEGGVLPKGTTGDKTIVLTWKLAVYNITYVLNDGEFKTEYKTTYTYLDQPILPIPYKEYYTFSHYENNDEFNSRARVYDGKLTQDSYGDVEIEAHYASWFTIVDNIITDFNTRGLVVENLVIPSSFEGVDIFGIGKNAISDSNVTSITIPSSVKTLGERAFSCSKLSNLIYEEWNITEIPKECFANTSILEFTVPACVTSIGEKAFNGDKLTKLEFEEGNNLTSIDRLYYLNLDELDLSSCTKLTTLTNFLYNSTIGTLTLPANITQVKFDYDPVIDKLIYCGADALTEININFDFEQEVKIIEFGDNLKLNLNGSLYNTEEFKTGKNCQIALIDSNFRYLTDSFKLSLGENTKFTKIGDSVFEGLTSLNATIYIAKECTSIGYCAFKDCENLTFVFEDFTTLKTVDMSAFANTNFNEDLSKSKIEYIGTGAFAYNKNFVNVTLPSTLTTIGNSAFSYCENLKTLYIPASVTCYGSYGSCKMFNGSYNLEEVSIPFVGEDNENLEVFEEAYYENEQALFTKLRKLTLLSQTEIIAEQFKSLRFPALKEIVLPSTLATIGENAFNGCSDLEKVDLSNTSVEAIGEYAFYQCGNLKGIVALPESLISIGTFAFAYCDKFTAELHIPSSLETIGKNAFYSAPISKLTFAEDGALTEIGESAFNYYDGYTLYLPSSLVTVGSQAFAYSSKLVKLSIPAGATGLSADAFKYCSALVQVVNDSPVALTFSSELTTSSIRETIKSGGSFTHKLTIDEYAVYEYGTNVYLLAANTTRAVVDNIPSNVTIIHRSAFASNKHIETVDLTNLTNLKIIDEYAFQKSSIKNVVIPKSVTSIGEMAFAYCVNLQTVEFEEGSQCKSLGSHLFYYGSIVRFIVPEKVTSLPAFMFRECKTLKYVHIPIKVTDVSSSTYINQTGVKITCEVTYENASSSLKTALEGLDVTWGYTSPSLSDEYTVTFFNGETELGTSTALIGCEAVYSGEVPTKAGTDSVTYAFAGWVDEEGNAVNITRVITDMNVYASFTETPIEEVV